MKNVVVLVAFALLTLAGCGKTVKLKDCAEAKTVEVCEDASKFEGNKACEWTPPSSYSEAGTCGPKA